MVPWVEEFKMLKDRCEREHISRLFDSTLIAAAFILLFVSTASAQAGSTGGAIGKPGKSVSGVEEQTEQRRPPTAPPRAPASEPAKQRQTIASPCSNLAGVWGWYNNVEVVIRADGSMSASNGDSGTWTCTAGQVVLNWRIAQDRVSLSSDGKRLTGSNVLGMAISNARK